MIVIVEGIDRVGKTTLCNMISKKLNINIFKNESFYGKYICKETEVELINQLINFIDCVGCDIILDRLHLSEYVYGLLNRGYINKDIIILDEMLSKMDCVLIYVKPTDINESNKQHGSDLAFHEAQFDAFFKISKIKKYCCNYNSLNEAVDFVKENYRK